MVNREPRTINWAVDVVSRLKGAQFPIDERQARERLDGLSVKGKHIDEILAHLDFPVETPAALLHLIAVRSER